MEREMFRVSGIYRTAGGEVARLEWFHSNQKVFSGQILLQPEARTADNCCRDGWSRDRLSWGERGEHPDVRLTLVPPLYPVLS